MNTQDRVYIVKCGKYDCGGVALATNDWTAAKELILERVELDDIVKSFSELRCLEGTEKLFTYTTQCNISAEVLEELKALEYQYEC